MQLKDLATVRAYHADRSKRFGVTASEALGWKNRDSQQRRFPQLALLGDFHGRSVLDVGCGHADLYAWLSQRHGGKADIEYTGIDCDSAFLEVAAGRYGGEPGTRFLLGEFGALVLPRADFVICCGALNYRSSDAGHLHRMIAKLFDACTLGLGLSLLGRVDFPDGILVACDPEETADYCRRLGARVRVLLDPREDYFTLLLNRDG